MDATQLLGYDESPNFLRTEEDFSDSQELAYVLRKARAACGLKGAYTLRHEGDSTSPIPVVYVCQAASEADAQRIHRRVWNQGIVPFILVQTPRSLKLYSGFLYKPPSLSETGANGILNAAIDFNEVVDQLSAFQAQSIDDGTLWKEWGDRITPETRVDWSLLENLRNLDAYLREQGVSKEMSHALIGKFVYFRYLKDRQILSDRKLAKWHIDPDSVFGREATLDSFLLLDQYTQDWLNGSIFPLDPHDLPGLAADLFQLVASVFAGDSVAGQLHLDFQAYDFSFIPIETLSVIYEQFLHLPEAGQATTRGRESGAYYTPIPLISFMQEELERKRPLCKGATILDPACGSGAFLVQCYHRLIEKRRQERRLLRPRELREMLTSQLFGVERDEDACRVAELSLILTLLDYVEPPDLENNPDFQLPRLRDSNIFEADFFAPDSAWAKTAATKTFDWIIGNPPLNVPGKQGTSRPRVDIEFERVKRGKRPRLRFEAKRLGRRHGVTTYLGADGLECFTSGKYPLTHPEAGMLGYVQSHNEVIWAARIETALKQAPDIYAVVGDERWALHPITPHLSHTYRSKHHCQLSEEDIDIFHILLRFCQTLS